MGNSALMYPHSFHALLAQLSAQNQQKNIEESEEQRRISESTSDSQVVNQEKFSEDNATQSHIDRLDQVSLIWDRISYLSATNA